MPLPPFDAAGDLPAGVHAATLGEVRERLGAASPRRRALADRLDRLAALARATGHLRRLVVFGSFVTAAAAPNDVDVFLVMDDAFDVGRVSGEAAILFAHGAAQAYFGASVFWVRSEAALGGEGAAIEQWQIKRDGTRRGIVEVIASD